MKALISLTASKEESPALLDRQTDTYRYEYLLQ